MHQRLLIIFAALAALTAPAFAGMNGIDCRCIYKGKYFEQGDTVCIRVDGKSRMARCDMALNNTSWTFISTNQRLPIGHDDSGAARLAGASPDGHGEDGSTGLALVIRFGISGALTAR